MCMRVFCSGGDLCEMWQVVDVESGGVLMCDVECYVKHGGGMPR